MGYTLRKKLSPLIFVGPFLALFAIFMLYPIIYSVVLSFSKYRAGDIVFVGLKNYTYLLTEPLFYKSLLNNFIILLIQVPIMILLALVFGNLLNSALIRGKGFFRMFTFMPVLIDAVSYSIIFSLFFNENNGLVNNVLGVFGVSPHHWFSNGPLAMMVIILALTWRWTGYNSIIILSGLQNISADLYEAADIDGANSVVKFFRITIPQLKPVIMFCVFNSINGTLQLFTEPQLLTQGGPANATLTSVLYLYQIGFKNFNFGVASAGSYILAIIIAIMTLIQFRVTKED
ncbi:carbohydrate ABC transporter permease [Ethanoligenens harbinense]|uniref:Binding-protein-dependent transport systems inner membrane component n=1 Tax=Ethanoligenens harbinense (strain DSM 18485 / JCM 12961 / CGMCC 1.5033 / YUAN-3) TaxID=663278 RepID=E6U2N1_ETHHY|nr:sugar ABC transporter permease [Ethanoligenens harbinense]ADU26322.1 binding-protein-dependent transport systems inner membrane component [Ethanoligenens harbinense YUAN-3]AVQ95456.1 sugar ABC transporter permease [Ethanoligenens harbinense YUAN-3]AYF38120.1 sugar ABC transporter permease [Ethanoligenens harbinense]AYF40866.1 sugar ABC transporter permease [Ethanoligenens harbinense]QCN91696.1 sugar ABC transporter permease [Ethanoligenens harbinense]